MAALAVVLAFAASLIFGLRGANEPAPERPAPARAPKHEVVVRDTRAKVEVLNGSGKQGLARLATEQLRDAGYDVVQFGNAAHTTAVSYVIDRIGKPEIATAVAQQLGIDSSRTQIDTTRYVEATVVLGKDWPPRSSGPQQTPGLLERLGRRPR